MTAVWGRPKTCPVFCLNIASSPRGRKVYHTFQFLSCTLHLSGKEKKKKKNKKCHISSFRANGNQTDGHETDFPSNLKIVPVTLPIPISTTCMIACTFMSRVFQDRQALKSSEWVFVPAEFGIPCLYLRIQRFLSILGLMKRWARYHSR